MTEMLFKLLQSQCDMIHEMGETNRPAFAGGLLLAVQLLQQRQEELDRERMYRFHGHTYGYPPCCVRDFAKDRTYRYGADRPGPWNGSGFVPCESCAEEARKDFLKFVSERIMPFRRTSEDFLIRLVEDLPLVPIGVALELREIEVEALRAG